MTWLDDFNPVEEMSKLTTDEANVVIKIMMNLQKAFDVENIDILKDSKSDICRSFYAMYKEMKNGLNVM